jgi:hypothetical protein
MRHMTAVTAILTQQQQQRGTEHCLMTGLRDPKPVFLNKTAANFICTTLHAYKLWTDEQVASAAACCCASHLAAEAAAAASLAAVGSLGTLACLAVLLARPWLGSLLLLAPCWGMLLPEGLQASQGSRLAAAAVHHQGSHRAGTEVEVRHKRQAGLGWQPALPVCLPDP